MFGQQILVGTRCQQQPHDAEMPMTLPPVGTAQGKLTALWASIQELIDIHDAVSRIYIYTCIYTYIYIYEYV